MTNPESQFMPADIGRAGAWPIATAGVSRGWRPAVAPPGLVFLLPAALLLIWYVAAAKSWLPPQILPGPGEVWTAGAELFRSGELQTHVGISLLRVVEGFAAGAGLGLVVGTAMGLSPTVEDYVRPLFIALAQIPSLGWIPFLMMIFGIGETLKIIVIAKAAFVPVTLNSFSGLRNTPRDLIEVGRALRFSRWQMLRRVMLPASVAPIFTGIRYGLTHAWLALVAVELLASSEGLGYLLVYGRQMFWLDTVIMAMALIGVIGFLLDTVLERIGRRLQRWKLTEVASWSPP
jgi:sulfonate transport system permease protein